MMRFVKAVCVLSFVYSAYFVECGTLKNNSNVVRRAESGLPGGKLAVKLMAENIEHLISYADKGLRGRRKQFGYIYMQPWDSEVLTFDDNAVRQALLVDKAMPSNAYQAYTWPQSPVNTNFRMARVDYSDENMGTNFGHTEYQLLENDGLERMLENFNRKHGSCPQYVILYSFNLPCMYPPNPRPIPRCAQMTVIAKKRFTDICKEAAFYVYTRKVSNKRVFRKTVNLLTNNGIFWMNPKTTSWK